MKFKNISGEIYLSYQFLKELGISERTIEKWSAKSGSVIKDGKYCFIKYSAVPKQTKSKLPSESELLAMLASDKKDSLVNDVADKLKYAQINKCAQYRVYYRDTYFLSSEDALKCAMKRAVWERLMEIYKESHSASYNGGLKKGALEMLYSAYNNLYKGQYSSKHAFLRTINTCKSAGFDSIIIDKRKLSSGNNQKYNELHALFVGGVLSIGKAYGAPEILSQIMPMCAKANIGVPSLSWVKTFIKNHSRHNEYSSRYGSDKTGKTMPYATMQPALHADKQWQVDGWNLPFYFKNEFGRLDKLTLIAIKDAYSRKIVGYSISRSENRISIMEAFDDAISNTGCLPFEIVVDNHSFNKTKEAESFINEITKIGVHWTVTENPQYKSIAERGFKKLGENYCKRHYGYIGQGIKTREKNGRSSDELIQQYATKAGKILSENEIILIGVSVVNEFNNTVSNGFNASPNHLYDQSEKPVRFEIDLYERLRILTKRAEHKISRGQINIVIAGKKYEYQVNAETFDKYNGKKVAVRYATPELIYLFDIKTDKSIGSVKQKSKIHGALADQTEHDLQKLAQNKGRTKGITTQSIKQTENIVAKALEINPDALEIMHYHTTPKDTMKEAEINAEVKYQAEKRGVDFSRLTTVPKTTEITNPVYLNKKQTRKDLSPFSPASHQISIIEPDYIDNE
ncbi:hypothetical protein [Mucilaginibacter sp.]|uniref:hypothetical protein n=1 Tax=Mucilaginibacter sp. TaxID=1882438 RepID=UPI000CAFA511|nr:hypothetical protein [Mucilaginibacter sp.]PLW88749.1 MAG: hypothetical protein C0154_15200 [Mucilaginibacter sp.]PMP65700.1 MAG: hypothetical protein C0191_03030 [Mucilaginibacter sp.]HEK20679.1 transposase [Bacteroidota bacterium]